METAEPKLNIGLYLVEVILATACFYFLFSGSSAKPAIWALFTIFVSWVILLNVGHDIGVLNSKSYDRWKLIVGFVLTISVLGAGLLRWDWWLIALGLVLAILWRGDFRFHQRVYRTFRRSWRERSRS